MTSLPRPLSKIRSPYAAALGALLTAAACSGGQPALEGGDNGAGSGGSAGTGIGTMPAGGQASGSGGAAGSLGTGGTTGGTGSSGGSAGKGSGGAPAVGGGAGMSATGGGGGTSGVAGGLGGVSAGGSSSGMMGGGRPGMAGAAGRAGGGMSGAAGTGASGSAGASGDGMLAGPARPSAGCGKASPATGTSSNPLMAGNHKYYVKLPTAYDASKPYITIIMFNPTGNPITWSEQNAGFESGGAKDNAIRVYPDPASEASGWGAGDVSFFQPLYDAITAAYCIDKARVYAFGESSGGDFASILGCEHADVLRGVAPCSTKDVSQYPLTVPTSRKCTGQVTSVVIQGKNDNVVGPANGPKTRDFYASLNHCKSTSTPVQGYTDTLSNCVELDGCDAGYPVYWCNHTDPNYSNTNHGWPAFAPKFLWGLFSKY